MTAQSSPEPSSPPAPAAAASPQVTIPLQPVVSVPVPATATPAAPVTKKPVLHERVTHKHAKALLEQMTADEIRTQLGTVSFFFQQKTNKQTRTKTNGIVLWCDIVLVWEDLHERQVHHPLRGAAEPGQKAALGRFGPLSQL